MLKNKQQKKRIGDLTHCEIFEASRDCLFEFYPAFIDNLLNSKYVVSSTFQPQTASLFSKLLINNFKLCVVFTKLIFDKFLEDFPEQFRCFRSHENMSISVRSGYWFSYSCRHGHLYGSLTF